MRIIYSILAWVGADWGYRSVWHFILEFLLSGNRASLDARASNRLWWVVGWPLRVCGWGFTWCYGPQTWEPEPWTQRGWDQRRCGWKPALWRIKQEAGWCWVSFFLPKGTWGKESFSFLFDHKWPHKLAAFKLWLWSIVTNTFYILCVHTWNNIYPYYFYSVLYSIKKYWLQYIH